MKIVNGKKIQHILFYIFINTVYNIFLTTYILNKNISEVLREIVKVLESFAN